MRTCLKPRLLPAAAILLLGSGILTAKPRALQPAVSLSDAGKKIESKYESELKQLQAEITKALPNVDPRKKAAFESAIANTRKAQAEADVTQQALGKVNSGKALIDHAKNKWIGGAEKGIAQAQAALKKANTADEREAAKKDLAKWETNKEEGLKALKERTEAYEKAKREEPSLKKANDAAQAALNEAKNKELAIAKALLENLAPVLASDKMDAKLAKCVILLHGTPNGLAAFAEESPDKAALLDQLLADDKLMKEMLVAGGAKFGKYGHAMEIHTAIKKASPKAAEGVLQRLALATSLEFAEPGELSDIDPVKRYLHYEKAFLDGGLDPAFRTFSTWEYRHVVNCDAPDEILAWGREMLTTYRPDHIYNPDYGWRYVSTVRTEVPYGSQNVKYDDPGLHKYQNIIMNGGICGRRAFFGRFILRSFGIPTWGVTQRAHAALSHWTPKGWVVNLGAGFGFSWWDKDEVSLSGTQFLLETQARAHADDYIKVKRAEWVNRVLGEPAYNERKKIAGGFWSNMALYQSRMLASTAVTLGPLGQELAEANEREQKVESATVSSSDQKAELRNGSVIIPAVAHGKASGKSAAMKGFAGGMQLHALGGFKTRYSFTAPRSGKYLLIARLATVQKGQKILISANDGQAAELAVPYTTGLWQETEPVEITLADGSNSIGFELVEGSRGVTIKEFTLTPVK